MKEKKKEKKEKKEEKGAKEKERRRGIEAEKRSPPLLLHFASTFEGTQAQR